MGLLAKEAFQTMMDRLIARLDASCVSTLGEQASGNANDGLSRYLDDSTYDADLQASLLPACAAVDRAYLTSNAVAWTDSVLQSPTSVALVRAIDAYVRTPAGGGHASLAAYLAAVGATVSPLAAEAIRRALGEGALTVSGSVVGAMAPLMRASAFDHVYAGTLGSLTDETVDAGDADASDVDLFAANGDVLVLQSRSRFGRVLIGQSTLASSNCGLSAKYFNGSSWADLTLTDATSGLSANGGMISWSIPSDWVPCNHDLQETPAPINSAEMAELYTVIIARTQATVVTPPVASLILCVPEPITNALGLYGLEQPPVAVVRITGANTATVTPIQQPSARFAYPASGLRLRAITPISAALTFTLGYKNEDGEASTKAQSAWADAKVPGDVQDVVLDTGDSGISEITPSTCAISTTSTSGLFLVERAGYERAIGTK